MEDMLILKRWVFSLDRKVLNSLEDLTAGGSEFHVFGPEIEKALLPISVLVLGIFNNELANLVE
jgi:hypothetical protein